jgi:hypothetical protein
MAKGRYGIGGSIVETETLRLRVCSRVELPNYVLARISVSGYRQALPLHTCIEIYTSTPVKMCYGHRRGMCSRRAR